MKYIKLISVDSTTVDSTGYDAVNKILRIKFTSGAVYDYYRVPDRVAEMFFNASSKGSFFNEYIKDVFEFEMEE
jgi:hypothetical protein